MRSTVLVLLSLATLSCDSGSAPPRALAGFELGTPVEAIPRSSAGDCSVYPSDDLARFFGPLRTICWQDARRNPLFGFHEGRLWSIDYEQPRPDLGLARPVDVWNGGLRDSLVRVYGEPDSVDVADPMSLYARWEFPTITVMTRVFVQRKDTISVYTGIRCDTIPGC